jgi:threonylcarbamoyladenosine tRNA methylthiotransferase MtaB
MIPHRDGDVRQASPSYAVYLDTVGCRLNQAEIESLSAHFLAAGCEIAPTPEAADGAVINSCTVTQEADRDSRQKVRQIHARNPRIQIAITGCWSTLYPREAAELPGVRWVIGNADKGEVVARMLAGRNMPGQAIDEKGMVGFRRRTRAFIPAQLGCDFACAYCVTRLARGAAHSVAAERVVKMVLAAERTGAREAVLTGVQLGAWGKDLPEPEGLRALLQTILAQTHIPRIRLSSLEPWNLNPSLLELWRDPRLCPHLHLPLQSGAGETLRRMNRPITPEQFAARVEEARRMIPGVAVTTDVLVGFPGETDEEFAESLAFIRRMQFAHVHLFTFSLRPGTPAAVMPVRIPHAIARQRAHTVAHESQSATDQYLREYLGHELEVLWEAGNQHGRFHGWTRNGIRVQTDSSLPLQNQLMRVRLNKIIEGEMRGEIVSN